MKQASKPPSLTSVLKFLFALVARRNAQGVLCVRLDMGQKVRLRVACAYVLLGSVAAGISGLFLLWSGIRHHHLGMALGLFAESGFILSIGLRTFWLWHKLQALSSTTALCERFGVEVEQLKRIAVENGIRPDANVSGQDYFRVADFRDITSLLRASSQPLAAPDTLLRPAARADVETGEQLLRAKA